MKKKVKIGFIGLAMAFMTFTAFNNDHSLGMRLNGISDLVTLNAAQAEFEFEETDGQYTTTVTCPDGSTFEGTDCDMSGGGCEYDDTSECNY